MKTSIFEYRFVVANSTGRILFGVDTYDAAIEAVKGFSSFELYTILEVKAQVGTVTTKIVNEMNWSST